MLDVRRDRHDDPRLEPFRDAVVELRRDGVVVGHVATTVTQFWSPFSFRRNQCVWFSVIWVDGRRENPVEDYSPPWPTIELLEQGRFVWDRGPHLGEYEAVMLDAEQTALARRALGISHGDP